MARALGFAAAVALNRLDHRQATARLAARERGIDAREVRLAQGSVAVACENPVATSASHASAAAATAQRRWLHRAESPSTTWACLRGCQMCPEWRSKISLYHFPCCSQW